MKKLLFQLDTDTHPSVFDTVVGYDGGADHVIGYGNCHEDNVRSLVEGTIFTRAPKEKMNTAIFVGGSNMTAGEHLFKAIQKVFFADFRVSIMLDSNGSNTTAAAAVAKLMTTHSSLSGKKAVILAGTGPVGRRAAVIMTGEGAEVSITSRRYSHAEEVCQELKSTFDVDVEPIEAPSNDDRGKAIENANIVLSTGAAGIQLLDKAHWENNPNIEMMADANATPPLGLGGTEMMDRGEDRNGKIVWGAIGFGTLKLAVHRACIAKLFESNDKVIDVKEIFAMAKEMA